MFFYPVVEFDLSDNRKTGHVTNLNIQEEDPDYKGEEDHYNNFWVNKKFLDYSEQQNNSTILRLGFIITPDPAWSYYVAHCI